MYVRDVARVELGSQMYDFDAIFNGQPTAAMGVYQLPGANALEVADGVVVADNWEETRAQWAGALDRLADRYRQGEAQVDPRDGKVCEHCQIRPCCRVFDPHTVIHEGSES